MACINFLLLGTYLGLRQQYTLELWEDNYDRRPLPEFALGDQICIRGEDETASSISTGGTTNVSSVSEHVIALETALERHANHQDPFDVDWKKAEAVYHRDLTQRIWCTVWKGIGVGLVRDKAMAIAIREAELGIRGYIKSRASFDHNRQLTPGHRWVFYLLESHLGDTLKQIDQDLPNEATHNLYKTAAEKFKTMEKRLICARFHAMKVIKRIGLSSDSIERFQIFGGGTGNQVSNTKWGLQRKWGVTVDEGGPDDGRESPVPATPYVKVGRNGLYACLTQGDDRTPAHDVVIDVCKLPWQSASAGLGAG